MPCSSLRPTSLEHTLLPTRACALRGGPLNNAISRDPQHRQAAYSPKCVGGKFSEVGEYKSLGSLGAVRYRELLPKLGLEVSQKRITPRSGSTSETPTRCHSWCSPASRASWICSLTLAPSFIISSWACTVRGAALPWALLLSLPPPCRGLQ